MTKSSLFFCLLIALSSCGSISRSIDKSLDSHLDLIFVETPATMVEILTDITKVIYRGDSLSYNTPVYLRKIDVSFVQGTRNPVWELENFEAIWVNDSLVNLKQFTIIGDNIVYKNNIALPAPIQDRDGLNIVVDCKYQTDFRSTKFQRLRVDYLKKNGNLIRRDVEGG